MLFLEGNVLDCLKSLPDRSIHLVTTSPPFYGLRNYGLPPTRWPSIDYHPLPEFTQHLDEETVCLGLEKTPESYIGHLVYVFRELRRVMRDDGIAFLNLGDSFSSAGGHTKPGETAQVGNTKLGVQVGVKRVVEGLKNKDLMMIPSRVALALQADGWYLRSDIIWTKPNPMPESVLDRPTRSHEYIFLLTKSQRYFYDHIAIQEDCVNGDPTSPRGSKGVMGSPNEGLRKQDALGKQTYTGFNDRYEPLLKRNKRDVWTISTQPFPGSHFAVFPEALVEPCIKAGTSEYGCCPKCGSPWKRIAKQTTVEPPYRQGNTPEIRHAVWGESESRTLGMVQETATTGWQPTCSCNLPPIPCTVLDPFGGSGTVAKVSRDLGRDSVYCDLNPDYVRMAMDRVGSSLFNNVEHRKVTKE